MKSGENSHFGNSLVRQSGQKWPDIGMKFNVPKSPHKHLYQEIIKDYQEIITLMISCLYFTVVLFQKRPEETLNIGEITRFRKVEKTAILERLW